jgi:hypothetical protein
MVWRAIDTPVAKYVSRVGSSDPDRESAFIQLIVKLRELGTGISRMGNELELNNPAPLEIVIKPLMR